MPSRNEESAAQQTLRLPELVCAIVTHLADEDNRASLCAALPVNHLWASVARPLLWRRAPWDALKTVAAARSAVYVAVVRELDVQLWPRPIIYRIGSLLHLPVRRRNHQRHLRFRPAKMKPWTLPHVHQLTCTYGMQSLGAAAPRMAAWAARFGA
jgi:hypothetical protein